MEKGCWFIKGYYKHRKKDTRTIRQKETLFLLLKLQIFTTQMTDFINVLLLFTLFSKSMLWCTYSLFQSQCAAKRVNNDQCIKIIFRQQAKYTSILNATIFIN